jgi:hypothetical protein
MDFAYVTFVNGKNIELMKNTIDSILCFSKYKIIVYCIDFHDNVFIKQENVIIKYLNNINLSSIKPYVIKDAIENGLLHGYCIEYHD